MNSRGAGLSKSAVVIIVIVVVILAIVGAVVASAGTISITVHSTHVSNTVSVTVSVDGDQIASSTLTAGQDWTFNHALYGALSCSSHTVSAASQGGGFGSQSDSATPSVCPTQTVAVNLYV